MSEIAIRLVAAVMAPANVAVVILILLWERTRRPWSSIPDLSAAAFLIHDEGITKR